MYSLAMYAALTLLQEKTEHWFIVPRRLKHTRKTTANQGLMGPIVTELRAGTASKASRHRTVTHGPHGRHACK